jgi:branched-chain amino acid transport system ATP-binding protein
LEKNSNKKNMLKTKDLLIKFGGLAAVDGVDFEIPSGTTIGLIGPNGSGKTTFFNIISGIYRPTQGEIWFNGENIVGQKPHIITKKGMARTFQNNRLFWQLSILDNVILGMYSRHKSGLFDVLFRYKKARQEMVQCAKRAVDILDYFSLN